jgi:CelD/BcsL family acetyltransferase involved in cellulose biosynthesis
MKARLIEDAGELAALAPAWDALWHRVPGATPFSHSAWALAWLAELPKGRLLTVAVEDAGRLAAILPAVEVGGVLRPLGFDVSDYAEPLAEPGAERALATALPLPALLDVRGGGGEPLEQAPAVALDPRAPVPGRMARSLAEARRRLAALGEAAIVPAADPAAFVDTLAALHAARWRQKGEAGVLAHPAVIAFHRRAATGLAAAGLLQSSVLLVDGTPAAAFHGLCGQGALHYYIGGFDGAFRAASPGSLLIADAMERAARAGLPTFDFLKGAEPYKYRWGATDRPRSRVRLAPAAAARLARVHMESAHGSSLPR